tara:strand:- start:10988 stop:11968 length:981 start_codon:yes stop_codon:yes gene_type:complete
MKAWQTLLGLLLLVGCSRHAAQHNSPSEPVSIQPDAAPIKVAADSPAKPAPPPVPKVEANDFSENLEEEAARKVREKREREEAAQAGAKELELVNLQALHQQAALGNVHAQVDLGLIYFEGKRVAKSAAHAQYWWTAAARQGNLVARRNLELLREPPPEGEVSFFGTRGKGRRFIFVIDKSGSMAVRRLLAAKRELSRTLERLPTGSEFLIYFFDHSAEVMPVSGLLPATPQNVTWAKRWMQARISGGGTDPRQALEWAFELKPDTVWLLSDGRFTSSGAVLKQLNRDNLDKATRINTLAFHDRSGELTLRAIAQAHGGAYRFVAP